MRSLKLLMTVVAAGSLAIGVVQAQAGQTSAGDVAVRQPASLSHGEKIAQSETIVSDAARLSEKVTALLNDARRDADMIRITCLDDKLTQINANLRNAEGRVEALKAAVDSGLQDHEFTVISVLGQKFKTLGQEASQCVGQEVYETGTSTNSTTVDPNEAGSEEDASNPPQPAPPVIIGAVPRPRSGIF